ncbi:MAG: SIS domain-containing protein [Dehalococcoidia bacterium]|nr:SIS domain-containing protein [Dehalococcoidia bacterium]
MDIDDVSQPSAYVDALRGVLARLDSDVVDAIADLLLRARDRRRTVYIVGNGGSASTAAHMATDLCKVTAVNGEPGVRAVSLPDHVALLTAWSNDEAYEYCFSGPLEALLQPGDVVIGISASGRSPNVLNAIRLANQRGAVTIGLTGFGGGLLAGLAQTSLVVDAHDYGLVEDVHLAVNHALTAAVRARIASGIDAVQAKAA